MAETIEYMEWLGGIPAPFQMHSDALTLCAAPTGCGGFSSH